LLHAEIDTTLALLGRDGVAALDRDAVMLPGAWAGR
jgi:hypothetical protein